MFISLCGGPCAGKSSVAEYLIRFHNFRELQIRPRDARRDDAVSQSQDPSLSSGNRVTTPSRQFSHADENGKDRNEDNDEEQRRGEAEKVTDPTAPSSVTTASGKQIAGKSHSCDNVAACITDSNVSLPAAAKRDPLVFADVDELKAYIFPRWRERFVTTYHWDEDSFEQVSILPFFLLVSVDAPLSVRYTRHVQGCTSHTPPKQPPTLETFVHWNDTKTFDPLTGIARLMYNADVRLMNPSSSLSDLHASLGLLSPDLLDKQRLRPRWDAYFMHLASLAALRSNCMKRRVGCVLVRANRVISTGYNGTPRNVTNCNEGGCARCNGTTAAAAVAGSGAGGAGAALSTCLCLHAEENALLEAGRERVGDGAILYCNTCPCLTCSVKIAQLGISEVVYAIGYHMDLQTARVLQEAGVKLRQFKPPRKGLIYLHEPDRGDFMSC